MSELTEQDVRRIVLEVLDEIAIAQQAEIDQRNARSAERFAEHSANMAALTADDPGDGPLVREMKAIMRGEHPK